MSLTNFHPHRRCNYRQYGFLATRPDLNKELWSHQHTSVVLGMFLPSANGVELVIRCDENEWSHLGLTKSLFGVQRQLLFLSIETLPVRLEVLHWDLRSLQVVLAFEWVLRIRGLLLTILLYHPLLGILNIHTFVASILLFALILRGLISHASMFSNSSMSAIRISPCQIHPAINAYPMSIPVETFLPNCWSLDWSRGDIQPLLQKELLAHLPGSLEHFADNNSIPWNQPFIFHPSRIATVLQTSLPLFCAPLFQQYHLFQNGEA